MKTYLVCVKSEYVRDTQIFDPGKYSDFELADINIHSESECDRWRDADVTPYIDIVQATDENHACIMAAERSMLDVRCLYAAEIKYPKSRKDELFDNMIAHIQELVSPSDRVNTFHAIGFTPDEMVEHEVCSAQKVIFRNLLDETCDDIQAGVLFDDGTLACLCGCNGIFEEGDYEILPNENAGGEKLCR